MNESADAGGATPTAGSAHSSLLLLSDVGRFCGKRGRPVWGRLRPPVSDVQQNPAASNSKSPQIGRFFGVPPPNCVPRTFTWLAAGRVRISSDQFRSLRPASSDSCCRYDGVRRDDFGRGGDRLADELDRGLVSAALVMERAQQMESLGVARHACQDLPIRCLGLVELPAFMQLQGAFQCRGERRHQVAHDSRRVARNAVPRSHARAVRADWLLVILSG